MTLVSAAVKKGVCHWDGVPLERKTIANWDVLYCPKCSAYYLPLKTMKELKSKRYKDRLQIEEVAQGRTFYY